MKGWRRASLFALACGALAGPAVRAETGTLRVCADPNNLPFSDRERAGFENELAALVARDFGQRVDYTWWAQRRGALRQTLKAEACDVVMGVPTSLEQVATTRPYYTSGYVFVSKRERQLNITSFDDPRLRNLRIGVQLVGDDYANTPPVHALSARAISENVRGYSVLGDYGEPIPAATVLRAVADDEVDLAIVWGPLAGYFAKTHASAMTLTLTPADDQGLPMRFSIGMGVRHRDRALRERLDRFIQRRQRDIDRLLSRYGVPRP